jgi:hypothetical protein
MRTRLRELFNYTIRFPQITFDKITIKATKKYKPYKNGDMMEYLLSIFGLGVSELI